MLPKAPDSSSSSPATGLISSTSRRWLSAAVVGPACFCAGVLLTYVVLSLAGSHGAAHTPQHGPPARRILLNETALHLSGNSESLVCMVPKATGIALSPMALANVTGDASLKPERLIVSARKREVWPQLARSSCCCTAKG